MKKLLRNIRKGKFLNFGNSLETSREELLCKIHTLIFDDGWLREINNNFHTVDAKILRSAHPTARTLRRVKNLGVTTVISFRTPGDISYNLLERKLCSELNIELVFFPLSSSEIADTHVYDEILGKMQSAHGKVLIHCKSGADRTGLVAALWLLHTSSPLEKKYIRKMLSARYLHFGYGKKACLKKYLEKEIGKFE